MVSLEIIEYNKGLVLSCDPPDFCKLYVTFLKRLGGKYMASHSDKKPAGWYFSTDKREKLTQFITDCENHAIKPTDVAWNPSWNKDQKSTMEGPIVALPGYQFILCQVVKPQLGEKFACVDLDSCFHIFTVIDITKNERQEVIRMSLTDEESKNYSSVLINGHWMLEKLILMRYAEFCELYGIDLCQNEEISK